MVITINPPATVNAGPDQTICAGSTVTLAGTRGGAATSSTWTTSGTGTFSNASLVNAIYTPSAADITAGTVTLTLTTNDPAGPCPAVSDVMVITINPNVTANAGPDQTVCGNVVTLGATAATGGSWSGGLGTFSSTTNPAATYTAAVSEMGTSVTLTWTVADPDGAGPCTSASDQVVITFNPPATVNAGPDQTICAGSTVTLAGTRGGSATSSTWTTSGTGTFNNASSLTAIYTPSAADITAGTVTLTLTTNDPTGPCPAVSDVMVITINPPATVNAGPDQTICAGSTVTLAGTRGGSATSSTWTTSGTGTFSNASLVNAIYTPSAADITAGTVTLTLTTNDPTGPCPAVSDVMVITINPNVTANAGPDQTVCGKCGDTWRNGSYRRKLERRFGYVQQHNKPGCDVYGGSI